MLIKIIAVSEPEKVKTYFTMEVNYKDEAGKTQGKKLMSFAFPLVFNALKDAKQGDVFEITTKKNDKGYWDWTDVATSTSQEIGTSTAKPASAIATKSSYETADERAVRQRLIVRQSSITAALGTLSVGAKAVDKDAVKALAQEYTDWVFEHNAVDDVINLDDDVPY